MKRAGYSWELQPKHEHSMSLRHNVDQVTCHSWIQNPSHICWSAQLVNSPSFSWSGLNAIKSMMGLKSLTVKNYRRNWESLLNRKTIQRWKEALVITFLIQYNLSEMTLPSHWQKKIGSHPYYQGFPGLPIVEFRTLILPLSVNSASHEEGPQLSTNKSNSSQLVWF